MPPPISKLFNRSYKETTFVLCWTYGANMDRNFGIALGTLHGKSCSGPESRLCEVLSKNTGSLKQEVAFRVWIITISWQAWAMLIREPSSSFAIEIPPCDANRDQCLAKKLKRREDASFNKDFKGRSETDIKYH